MKRLQLEENSSYGCGIVAGFGFACEGGQGGENLPNLNKEANLLKSKQKLTKSTQMKFEIRLILPN